MPPWKAVPGKKGQGLHRRGWSFYLERPWRQQGRWKGEVGADEGKEAGSVALECCGGQHRIPESLFLFPPTPPQEERALSGTLEASKALLEEQLEAARERCARLHETQRENLLLRTRLGEAHAVSLPH